MQTDGNDIVVVLREISTRLARIDEKMDISHKLLEHLCQCEDRNQERKIHRQEPITASFAALKQETAKIRQEFESQYKLPERSGIPVFPNER